MKDKLILILSLTTAFSLGCATATVMVATAAADPNATGGTHEQCAAFLVGGWVDRKNEEDSLAKNSRVLPAGWKAVGGGSEGFNNYAIACRTVTVQAP